MPRKRLFAWAASPREIDRRPGNNLGHPVIGYSQELWAGYRRYADPTIEEAVSTLKDSMTDEIELPAVIWEFFGYPRRIIPVKENPATKPTQRGTPK